MIVAAYQRVGGRLSCFTAYFLDTVPHQESSGRVKAIRRIEA